MPQTNRVDDDSISDDEILWRRVHPKFLKTDPNTNLPHIQSSAFRPSDEMSAYISSETSIKEVMKNYSGYGLAGFRAKDARALECVIVRDSSPENPGHVLICGKNNGCLTGSQASQLRNKAWLIPLDEK